MSAERDTYKYRFVGPDGRIKHSGITNDLDRREGELRRQYGEGNIRGSSEMSGYWHHARVTNGPTEAVNNLIKRVKRAAFGFRRFAHYRIRALLYAGKPALRV